MTLVQLEYALALHRLKSFVKASEACFVTQPTLSMQIQKLEEELGIILFDRKKKPIMTTAIGEEIIRQAQEVISNAKAIKEIVGHYRQNVSGELRLGIIPTVAPYLLPMFIPNLKKDMPNVQLQIEEKTTDQIISDLLADNIDLGILATPLNNPRITEYPLYKEAMLFYVSPKHSLYKKKEITLSEVNKEDLWLLNKGHCFRNQMINLCDQFDHESLMGLAFESGSIETLIRIIDGHNGLTMIPESAIAHLNAVQIKNVRPVMGQIPGRQISIVVSRTYLKKGLIAKLEETIKTALPKNLRKSEVEIQTPV